ncbi:cytochrome c oxidase assembly protein [Streptomyces broussonetiae]|uniref:Cytochrome c oxidase assembly protein n=1 Tax=Streptomyces broussonetiae TaxID=2686304 RepID=A0ABV5EM56_9ACTN
MTRVHVHPAPADTGTGSGSLAEPYAAALAILAAGVYLLAAHRLRRRGDAWPWPRDVAFTTGCITLTCAVSGPLPGGPFTAHMTQHLIVGMAAPLLLVLARPLTLALRSTPPGRVRRGLLAMRNARPLHLLLFPPVAAVLDIGGLWLPYRTGLFAAAQHQPLPHAVTHAHVLAAGLLLTFTVCQLDPVRHRWSLAVRGPSLLAVGAGHAVLAKSLYAAPPPGTAFTTSDLHTGAQLMYYGGDLVEISLAAVLAVQWYTTTGRAAARVCSAQEIDRPRTRPSK